MRSMMLGGKEHGGGRGLAINRSVSRDRLDVEASTVPSSWRSFLHNKLRKICPNAQCVRLRSLVVQYLRSPNQCLSCFFAGAKQNQASTKKGPSTNQAELVWGLRASPAAERVALSAWADAFFILSDAFDGCAARASRLRSFRAPCRSVGGVCQNFEEPQLFEDAYI